ncbi:hypothetical protein EVAR_92821_1 [Eumeta japonica]|uniref:Uncharacterized protein n=1 Tax=Eumeta variegata TaxID=151549 RepID=A0A4C1TD96_EUMVA|nr:hypothetical protein EVAR_92821_1 [Eumeta japonica]
MRDPGCEVGEPVFLYLTSPYSYLFVWRFVVWRCHDEGESYCEVVIPALFPKQVNNLLVYQPADCFYLLRELLQTDLSFQRKKTPHFFRRFDFVLLKYATSRKETPTEQTVFWFRDHSSKSSFSHL